LAAGAIAAAAVIGFGAFSSLSPGEENIPWEPYSEARLAQLQAEGRTVMLDFTASWCVNCKINTKFAIDTEATKELIEELDAIPMLADWSDRNEQIKSKLAELQSNSIPLLAIYPGSTPSEPILLRDLVSQASVLEALKQAGPSVNGAVAESNVPSFSRLASTELVSP
ncbi:MAG: thioredoxin family protein, partial [Planctomycetota bacterium]